ncbi:MAG: DUF2953 domain-containing protein [Oliverpabstia intestinalis]|uniref:DUF2953 domain-containing protein n=1 Tax=Oliverpabstia sp. TaxID=2815798 RepID=UPI00240A1F7B|nr:MULTISPECIES: DUF2953 domain-containing protein [Oliverpabstia]MCI7525199.1 DUF2953 domain-containing protein [Oliverpabstia sp.]MDD6411007.1 DUF2953 domain-containing protein [Oliverpabstia intestinalis]MDY5790553.1 DUF2953 domain-containing protein [Oliverpabstia intestinalis]
MYVILTILKILGIILLVLLVIVFSVLFVPVRYRLEGEKSSPGWSEANGKVKVSWVLHLIHLRIQYQEKELDWECYLFGVPLKKAGAAVREWKKKRRKKKVQEQKERRKKAVQQKNEPEKRTAAKKKGQEKPLQIEEKTRTAAKEQKSTEKQTNPEKSKTAAPEAKKTEIETAERKQQEKEKVSDKLSRFWNRCKKIVGSILEFPGKLKKKLTNIRLTFRGFYDKIKRWRTLWNEESTLAALHFLTEKGRKLIRHVLPRKIRGSITFGCEDPALTGQILGAVAIAYPLYGKGVAVYPRFEEKILEGQLQMKGRIVVACLLWQAWKIYRNPDVRKTLKKIR